MYQLEMSQNGYFTSFDKNGSENLRLYSATSNNQVSKSVVVTFASFCNPGRPSPSFAFLNTMLSVRKLEGLNCDVVYLLSNCNDWYQSGIRGLEGANIFDSAQSLNTFLNVRGYEKFLFMGNSMGGYAALAYGALCSVDGVIAFAPQTRFDLDFCRSIGEARWLSEFASMRESGDIQTMAIDSIWRESTHKPKATVYVGEQAPQDLAYASEVSKVCNIEVKPYEQSGHDIALDFRNSGALHKILADYILKLN